MSGLDVEQITGRLRALASDGGSIEAAQVKLIGLDEIREAAGARWAGGAAEVAASVDHVITCLPSPAVSELVLGQILPAMKPGATWIEMSTLGRDDVLRLAGVARDAGVRMLELPVTGGVHLAARGEITMLPGGDTDLVELHRPAMEAMGARIFHMGPLGASAIIKVITNMLAFIHLVAAGEAMMLPAKYGVDPDATWRAIRASSGNSFVHETESKLVLSGSYNVKFTMDLACKDLGLVNGIAEQLGVPLELGSHTQQIFRRARGLFGSEAQSPEVVRMIEQACGLELRAPGYPTELVAE